MTRRYDPSLRYARIRPHHTLDLSTGTLKDYLQAVKWATKQGVDIIVLGGDA